MNPHTTTEGEFSYLSPVPEELNTDYSRLVRGNAKGVYRNCTDAGVKQCLSTVERENHLVFRGGGYSCSGIAVAKNGELLESSLAGTPPILELDQENSTALVSSRIPWGIVESELLKKGYRVPVLPDFMKLTVGGTISVGGIGVDSLRNGFQADLVQGAEILLPGSGSVQCDRTNESEVFRFSAGSAGNAGWIKNVRIRIEKAHSLVRVFRKTMGGLIPLASQITESDFYDHPAMDHFQAWYSGGTALCEAGDYLREDSLDKGVDPFFRTGWEGPQLIQAPYPFSLSERREKWLSGFSDPVAVWSDFFFTPEGFRHFLAFLEEKKTGDPRFASLKALYILIVKRPPAPHPSPFLPGKAGDVFFSAGIYSMARRGDPADVIECLGFMEEVAWKAKELDGILYRYGFPGPGHENLNTPPFHPGASDELSSMRDRLGLRRTGFMD